MVSLARSGMQALKLGRYPGRESGDAVSPVEGVNEKRIRAQQGQKQAKSGILAPQGTCEKKIKGTAG